MSNETSSHQGTIIPSSSGSGQSRYSNQLKSLMQYNVPNHLLADVDDGRTKDDEDELADRLQQEKRARSSRVESSKHLRAAEKDLQDFKQLLTSYNIADNVRNPTTDQQRTITDMNQSVVDVIVAAGANEMQRKIAQKSLELKKAVDDARAIYDRDCKVIWSYYGNIAYLQ